MSVTPLASSPGWRVSGFLCAAKASDPVFEEQHASLCISAVTRGTFRYRTLQGRAALVPGAVMLGNPGACYECGHDHDAGDHCIAFHFEPGYFEDVLSSIRGARRIRFDRPGLPPSAELMPILVAAEAAADDPVRLEEIGLELGGAVAGALSGSVRMQAVPSPRSGRRIAEIVHFIEKDAEAPTSLARLAREAATSPYHLLREFRRLTGATPHQFVLGLRLRRAATRLRRTADPVSVVALESGFGDISEFNRRFRRVFGESPSQFRATPQEIR